MSVDVLAGARVQLEVGWDPLTADGFALAGSGALGFLQGGFLIGCSSLEIVKDSIIMFGTSVYV